MIPNIATQDISLAQTRIGSLEEIVALNTSVYKPLATYATFDGTNDAVQFASDDATFEVDDFSAEVIFKRARNNTYEGLISYTQVTIVGGDSVAGWLLRISNTNKIQALFAIADSWETVEVTETLSGTDWHTVKLEKSGTSVSIWFDGVEVKTGTLSSATIDYSTITSLGGGIGAYWNGSTGWASPFQGSIALAKYTTGGLPKMLCKFNDGQGTTVTDYSGNGNHGTASGITESTFWNPYTG